MKILRPYRQTKWPNSRVDRTWTCDHQFPKLAFYQLNYYSFQFREWDSNPHGHNDQEILSLSCIPISSSRNLLISHIFMSLILSLRRQDSNRLRRPSAYGTDELTTALLHDIIGCTVKFEFTCPYYMESEPQSDGIDHYPKHTILYIIYCGSTWIRTRIVGLTVRSNKPLYDRPNLDTRLLKIMVKHLSE